MRKKDTRLKIQAVASVRFCNVQRTPWLNLKASWFLWRQASVLISFRRRFQPKRLGTSSYPSRTRWLESMLKIDASLFIKFRRCSTPYMPTCFLVSSTLTALFRYRCLTAECSSACTCVCSKVSVCLWPALLTVNSA